MRAAGLSVYGLPTGSPLGLFVCSRESRAVGWLLGGGTARRTPPPSRNQSPEPCARASQPYLRKSFRKGREKSIRPVRAKYVRRWSSVHSWYSSVDKSQF